MGIRLLKLPFPSDFGLAASNKRAQTAPMSAAKQLVGLDLKGSRKGQTWRVKELKSVGRGHTPGQFSIGYEVENEHGKSAFLKASDISMAMQSDDPVKALQEVTTAHEFERSILEHCEGNRLENVVTALDAGSHVMVVDGVQEFVFFIVFELANSDLRVITDKNAATDLAWVLSAGHSLCVAMSQIHGVGIYHNDFKPGNALLFDEEQKVADFGRATSPNFPVLHDKNLCAGDRRFAPPEQLYYSDNAASYIDPFVKAKAGDLYNLGSVLHFLITKRMLTPEIVNNLDKEFKPLRYHEGWCDSYDAALPYWRHAHDAVMTEFYDDLPEEWTTKFKFVIDALYLLVTHLCEPDFRLRGDLKDSKVGQGKYTLTRVISKLDSLRNQVLVLQNVR